MATKHTQSRLMSLVRRDPLDLMMYFFSIATPLFELPQVWEIYANQSAHNVSLATWGFFCVDNLAWIIYSLRKKEWPLLLTSFLYEVLELAIVVGIIRYS